MASGGLLKRWGLGIDLIFDGGDAAVKMNRARAAVGQLRASFRQVGDAASNFAGKLVQVGAVLTPLAAAFGLAVGKGSSLAADLEAQALTMRVLLGDGAKAAELIDQIRQRAASTPFAEGDLIEGSKRLLRLTKDNTAANLELLDTAMTMAALNPTATVEQAVEAILDATSGGGFERLKEFGIAFRAEDFASSGRAGGEAWGQAVTEGLQSEIQRVTKGEDLVGALSQTFTGRLSTLRDGFTNALREIGQVVNAEVGPMFGPITERVNGLIPVIRQAAEDLAGHIRGMAEAVRPHLERLIGWWDSLGTEGQARVFLLIGAVGALSAVLVPVGGAIGAVVFAVTSLIGAVAAAWPVITAVGGAVGALLAPEILIPIAMALALVAAAAVALFAALSEEGEGPLDTLIRLGNVARVYLVEAFDRAKLAWQAFAGGFGETFAGLEEPMNRLREAFAPITDKLAEFFALLNGRDGQAGLTLWHMIGQAVGIVGNFLITKIVAGMELVAAGIDIVLSAWRPMALALDSFIQGLVGLVTGSMDAEDAIHLMVNGVAGAIVGMVNMVFQFLAGAVELLIRSIVLQVAGLPGMEGILEATGNLGANAIGDARRSFEQATSNAIAGIDLAENRRNAAKGEAGAPVVNVSAELEGAVDVNTSICLDGQEIARAQGAAQLRAGQRTGDSLPAEARGRVARGGRLVALQPSEVW